METVCIIFLLSTKKHTGHTRHCFHHNPRPNQVVFWRSLAFCTSAPRRIWRASRLVAFWTSGRLSWKVLKDVSNTGTRSKKMNQWVIRNWKDEVHWNWELLRLDRLGMCSFSCRLRNKSQFPKTKQDLLEYLPLLSLSHLSNLNMSQVSLHHGQSCQLATICVQSILHLIKMCMFSFFRHRALNLWQANWKALQYVWRCLLPSIKPAIWRGWSKISIVPGPVEHVVQLISSTFGCLLWNLSNHTLPTCKEKRTGANIMKQNPGIIWDTVFAYKMCIWNRTLRRRPHSGLYWVLYSIPYIYIYNLYNIYI